MHRFDSRKNVVATHYNDRQQKTREERTQSPIYAIRCVNNWVKSVLIEDHVKKHSNYLDLCGGCGGDLEKLAHNAVDRLTLVDIASEEVARARERYETSNPNYRVPRATFVCADAFVTDQTSDSWAQKSHFDAVSCQLALHYAFESETKLRSLLYNVAKSLKQGGVFLCSFTDGERVYASCFDLFTQQEKEFDNGVCRIRFENGRPTYIYGTKYRFSLGDAIFDCPEYCVHLPTFIAEAKANGLDLVRTQTFDELCHCAFERCPHHRSKWDKMVALSIPKEQWQTISLYRACVFVRNDQPLRPIVAPSQQAALSLEPPPSTEKTDAKAKESQLTTKTEESPSKYVYEPFKQEKQEKQEATKAEEQRSLSSYENCWHDHERCKNENFVLSGDNPILCEKELAAKKNKEESEEPKVREEPKPAAKKAKTQKKPSEAKKEEEPEVVPKELEKEKVENVYMRKPNNAAVVRDGKVLAKGEKVKPGDKFAIGSHVYVKQTSDGWRLQE